MDYKLCIEAAMFLFIWPSPTVHPICLNGCNLLLWHMAQINKTFAPLCMTYDPFSYMTYGEDMEDEEGCDQEVD